MRSLIPDYLSEVLGDVAPDTSGARAGYIPELATADPERLAAVFATVDGVVYGAGDIDVEFTIQSISKPFTYGLALADRGFAAVLAKVGVEPSGEAFNEISLEDGTGRPRNPMINAGAITVHSLAGAAELGPGERLDRVVSGLSAFAGRRLEVDESVCVSELAHAHRNLAIGHMLRSHDVLSEDPATIVEGYTRQCALLVTARDLALMAATLANRGVNPRSGERVVPEPVVRQVLSVMATCGMYDAAGDWATQVGIPAKSGVAGGLIGALPGQIGIATFSPRLDAHGTSVRGVSLFERFSSDMGLHVMEVPPMSRAVVRSDHVVGAGPAAIRVVQLQGGIRFAGAERVVREVVTTAPAEATIALDLTMVHSIDDVARRMLLEIVRRLTLEGHVVYLVDPESVLPDPDPGDGGQVTVVRDLDEVAVQEQRVGGAAHRREAPLPTHPRSPSSRVGAARDPCLDEPSPGFDTPPLTLQKP
ncbi:glutaminase [Nocardioides houyundeii]|uniref:glutaminase n=1 Tax=Nocardioides houyundeii TaxID=2045452 RepID=UPI000DF29A44|nr:glutaminase [Nocardioides houyundeii]